MNSRSAALSAFLKRRAESNSTNNLNAVSNPNTEAKKKVRFPCLPSFCHQLRIYTGWTPVLWLGTKTDNLQPYKLLTDDNQIRAAVVNSVEGMKTRCMWLYSEDMFFDPFSKSGESLLFNISILDANQGIFTEPKFLLESPKIWKNRAQQVWTGFQNNDQHQLNSITFHNSFISIDYKEQPAKLRQVLKEKTGENIDDHYMYNMFELRIGDLVQCKKKNKF